MKTFIALVCLMAVLAEGYSSAIGLGLGGLGGYGGGLTVPLIETIPIIKPQIIGPALSTLNVNKEAPIPIIRKVSVAPIATPIIASIPAPIIEPIISAPILKEIPLAGYGLGGLGLGYGHGKLY